MADEFEGKKTRGERLRINAATWNDIIDVVRWWKRQGLNVLTGTAGIFDSIKSNHTILVKNQVGYNLTTSFKILRLSSPLVDVPLDPHGANRRMAFDAFSPVSAGDAICILQAPCEYNEITKAVISGVTVCRVRINNPSHEWANPIDGEIGYLDSGDSGQARILWYGDSGVSGEAEDNVYMAVVNLVGVAGDLDSLESGDSGSSGELTTELVTELCPVFEDVTYEQAIEEITDLLSYLPGYVEGNVLTVVDGLLEWTEPVAGPEGPTGPEGPAGPEGPEGDAGPNIVTSSTTTDLTGYLKGNGVIVSAVASIPAADYPTFIAAGGTAEKGAVPSPGATSHSNFPYSLRDDGTFKINKGEMLGNGTYVPTRQSTASATRTGLATAQSFSFTLDAAADVWIIAFASAFNSAGAGNPVQQVFVDIDTVGTMICFAGSVSAVANFSASLAGAIKVNLTAGFHTLTMQFATTGGTAFFEARSLFAKRA